MRNTKILCSKFCFLKKVQKLQDFALVRTGQKYTKIQK